MVARWTVKGCCELLCGADELLSAGFPKKGELLEHITVPAANGTSCAFGEKNQDAFYYYSQRRNELRAAEKLPRIRRSFKVKPGAEGMPTIFFRPGSIKKD